MIRIVNTGLDMCEESNIKEVGEPSGSDASSEATGDDDEVRFVPPSEDRLMPWLAALESASVSCHMAGDGSGRSGIMVPRSMADAAMGELREYEEVNRDWPPVLDAPEAVSGDVSGASLVVWLLVGAYLLRLHSWTGEFSTQSRLFATGALDVDAFRAGQWWRAATALSLHADLSHALSNALWGMFFGVWASTRVGAGVALGLTVYAGVVANITEGVISSGGRVAVGASTATFSTVGLICAFRFCDNWRDFGVDCSVWSRTWLPLAAGFGMLAFLGSGGTTVGNVDLVGHASGFLWGMGTGAVFLAIVRDRPGPGLQFCSGCGAIGAVVLAWWWGLSASA